ncbi:ABC transporter ATP-binding protein [Desulfosudis oleivorans]|uniref:ABC transporter-related protein n=1 Tax=Desulfosudis oleivorans (strain DSM 6200 / JCM 39069 / Hxd3) TaxID=96561 RepID=A8ZWB9_DESOH|nr:ABC transporter ATP-binding protein [Desulfosudis oleivorans]ABW66727.1 ABC transporter-related protein [Desulfosudis oleivorans Hxd3]
MRHIIVEHLSKIYGSGDSQVAAVSNMNFTIDSGEFVGVMGESGAGKSTLLSVLGAMNTPSAGRYLVDGIDVYGLSQEKQADFRREFLGFVFQRFHLIPYLTVLENVMLPLTTTDMNRREKQARARAALSVVGLENKWKRLPSEISGGENERVAVARAIVNDPPILLADEPTGNLDSRNTGEVMKLLCRLNENGATIVMVTHSAECAAYAGRVMTLADGRLVSEGRRPIEVVSPSFVFGRENVCYA